MTCEQACEFLDAYLDKELDVVNSAQFERHMTDCAACRETYQRYAQIHNSVRTNMEYFHPPDSLEQKLRAKLNPPRPARNKLPFQVLAIAASVIAVLLSTLVLVQALRHNSEPGILAQQVVSSHIRSLQANHLSDVISTDQHTVKPWFNGKLDFAPSVKDLSSKGFPLVGGRLDYLDDHAVAALVYKRHQHTINLFLWPTQSPDANPHLLTIKGYNLLHWTYFHMTYWAVSDLNTNELTEFTRDLRH